MSQRVELYNFNHGQHRNLTTGKFLPLQPNKLGRPLTHDEMDYNMDYMEQTLGGYKIFGSAPDTTLSESDIDKVLVLHRITLDDVDVQRYLDAGFELGDWVWVPVEAGGEYTSGESCLVDIVVSSSGPSDFGQSTSSIFVTVTGLQGNAIILINGNVVQPDGISGNTYRFDGYGAGVYTVTAIDDAFSGSSCSTSRTITIEEGPDPCADFNLTNTSTTLSGTDAEFICELDGLSLNSTVNADFGQSNGQIFVEVLGNVDYSTLVWSLNGQIITPINVAQTNVFNITGVAAGNYSIVAYVSGNADCSAQLTVTVEGNPDDCASFILTGASHTNSGGYECNLESQTSTTPSGVATEDDCDNFLLSSTSSTASGGFDCSTFVLTGQFSTESGGFDCSTFIIDSTSSESSGGYECDLAAPFSTSTSSGSDSTDI